MCSSSSGYLRTKYFLKSHVSDLITSSIALIGLFLISVLIPCVAPYFPYIRDSQIISNILQAVIILISAVIVIYLRLREKKFYFISLTRREHKDDWIGKGGFDYERIHNCFSITNSESGYIFSKCLTWSDYKFFFKFKISKDCLGVIVRAVNLSNYIMLQIQPNGVKPHIRINGGWKWWEPEDTKMSFTNSLSLDKWYKCVLSCNKGTIDIKLLDDDQPLFERQWAIPDGKVVFPFKNDSLSIDIPFPINLEYGSIGFRNWGDEKALIKDILVQKI